MIVDVCAGHLYIACCASIATALEALTVLAWILFVLTEFVDETFVLCSLRYFNGICCTNTLEH
jgi:hypothetical protein